MIKNKVLLEQNVKKEIVVDLDNILLEDKNEDIYLAFINQLQLYLSIKKKRNFKDKVKEIFISSFISNEIYN